SLQSDRRPRRPDVSDLAAVELVESRAHAVDSLVECVVVGRREQRESGLFQRVEMLGRPVEADTAGFGTGGARGQHRKFEVADDEIGLVKQWSDLRIRRI